MRSRSRHTVVAAAITVLVLAAVALGVAGAAAGSSTTATYLVLYKKQALPAGAAASIQKAGGTLVYGYGQIGVAVASSDSSTFASTLASDSSVDGVASTAGLGTQVDGGVAADDAADAPVSPGLPAPGNDSLSGLQWDMVQIHAPEARAINGGSPAVVVGDIDTGLDFTHPDLAPNVDFADSVSCVGGVPNTNPAAWMDDNGHGTHTAGTIAAAKNRIGIVGVAPNVKIAGIKAGNAAGFFFPSRLFAPSCGPEPITSR